MTCANPDRSQLFALSANDGPSSASDRSASAESTPQKPKLGGSLTEARDRAYSQAIQHRPGTSKRAFYEGQTHALTHLALSLGAKQ